MRVLLFSVTAGGGHNVTAKAIACALEERGVKTETVDTYRTAGRFLYHFFDKGYLFVIAHLGRPYGFFYRMAEKRKGDSFHRSPTAAKRLADKFKAIIDNYRPDVIVATHSLAARILDIVRERYGIDAKTVGIVTDFTMHPYWEDSLRLDRLVIPCEPLTAAAIQKGFRPEQLLPLGIPIHRDFSLPVEKEEAKRALGLDPALPAIMLMNGSMGSRNLIKNLRRLDKMEERFQIIVVCGGNKRVYRSIARKKWRHPVRNLSYTAQIPELMKASDAIVTKPGGLSTCEALASRLPIIISSPIPGHETRNADFLTEMGAALLCDKKTSLEEAVRCVLDPSHRARQLAAIDRLRKPCAVADLCDAILALGDAPSH